MNEHKGTRYRRMERGLRLLEAVSASSMLALVTLSPTALSLREAGGALAVLARVPTGPPRELAVAAFVLGVTLALVLLAATPFAWRRQGPLARRFGLAPITFGALLRTRVRRGAVLVLAGAALWTLFARLAAASPWLAGLGTALLALAAAGVAMLLAPWVVTLSSRVRPIRDEALTGRVHALASRAQLRLAGVHEWVFGHDGDHANAALIGVVGPRRLLLSDTLLQGCAPEEIDAVVAHELGHHVHGHTWRRVRAQATSLLGAMLAAHAAAAGPAVWLAGTRGSGDPASIPWMLCGAGLAALAARPWRLAQSRAHEAEADAFALSLTGRPEVLQRVLARLGERNLTSDDESLVTRAFFLTHPPIPARIAAAGRAAGRPSASNDP